MVMKVSGFKFQVSGFKLFLATCNLQLIIFILLFTVPSSLPTVSFAAHDTLINPQSGAGGAFPQNPSEEYSSEVDRYLLNFSAFQYLEGTGTYRVKAVVTVRDRISGEPYQGPLTMNLIKRSLFGSKDEGICNFDAPFENRYICYANIPYEANFIARVYFNAGGEEVTAEFPMRVGRPRSHIIFLGTVSIIFVAMVALIAYLKRNQKRPAPVG